MPESDPISRMMEAMAGATPPTDVPSLRGLLDSFMPLMNADPPAIGPIRDGELVREVGGTRVTADVFAPTGAGPHPVLVYLHGGGWVAGSPKSHRKLTMRFAEAGYVVISVDYRLAPEAPFPGGFEDCVFAVRWAAENARRFGGDPRRIAIGGDSAGGNLSAAVAAALAADSSAPRIHAALLIYGVFDFATVADQPVPPGPQGEAARKAIDMMTGAYLGENAPAQLLRDPRVSPLHVAAQLPPSFLVVGTADGLLGQQEALAAALARAGVAHENVILEGMPHGFLQMEFLPPARAAIERAVAFLRKHVPA